MTTIYDRDKVFTHLDRHRARALGLRQEYVGELFAKGRGIASSSRGRLGMFAAAFALATAAFWATMLTSPPVTEATTISGITSAEIERSAPRNVPIREAGVIACTYVLTDEHHCN